MRAFMLAPTVSKATEAVSSAAELGHKTSEAIEPSVATFLTYPSEWPGLHQMLDACHTMSGTTATILMVAGAGFLAYGPRADKLIMSLNCAVVGAWAGGMIGKHSGAIVPGLLIGGFLGGLVAWPLIRFSIQLVAGGVGFMLGCCLWRTFPQLDPSYAWAGGAIGSTFLFMLTFSSLRWATLLAIGTEGAALLIAGLLGWLFQISSIRGNVDSLVGNRYTLPTTLLVSTFLAVMYQHRQPSEGSAQAKPA